MEIAASTSKVLENDAFLTWFTSHGGSIHSGVGLTIFPTIGRGAVALHDIKKDTILFTVPRSLTLSLRTSCLPSKFGEQAWRRHTLHKGWVGLILCMLWESAAGSQGKWSGYLSVLPDTFQTPMFWSEYDLQELEGTTIFDKIGKAEAEKDYYEKLLPAVKSRPDIFPKESVESNYSLHKYHIMGSSILSRSFNVEKWEGETNDDGDLECSFNAAPSDGNMDIIETAAIDTILEDREGENEEHESEDDQEDPADVAMVPMADMLNAQYNHENARLCYESEDLQMISTRDIKFGEQIWNTYGNPPNSGLLRRYGHVDIVPIPGGREGNPADMVEIRADLVVGVLREHTMDEPDTTFDDRIDWWLEAGGDDTFTLETTLELPPSMISFILLLIMPVFDWEKTREKGKIPKPRLDSEILHVAGSTLEKRLETYRTSIEEDEAFLSTRHEIGSRKWMATVVRLGEKRILQGALDAMKEQGRAKRKDVGTATEYKHSKKMRCQY